MRPQRSSSEVEPRLIELGGTSPFSDTLSELWKATYQPGPCLPGNSVGLHKISQNIKFVKSGNKNTPIDIGVCDYELEGICKHIPIPRIRLEV